MKPYPKYKPSDIQWLGDIPEHWEVKKIRHLSPVKRGASPRPIDNPIYFDENGEFSWVRIADVTASDRYLENTTQKLSDLGASLSVKRYPNDFFLSIAGSVGKPIITKIKCCIHDGFVWFPELKINPEYLFYLFSTGLPYQGLGKMGTQLNLNTDTVADITLPIPPIDEIEAVIQYLDQKTAQIDTLIAQKQRLITLLKEERMAFVNEILSNKSFPLKKLKYVVSLKSGSGITSEVIRAEGQYPVFGGNGLRGFYSNFTHDGEYILIGRQGALCGNINYTTGKFWASEHAIVVTILDNSDMKWLGELLRVMNLNQYSVAAAQPGLSVENIINLKIPYPSITKQIEISKLIRKTTSKIDATLAKIVQEIELLKEYRVALISEVVTGKISVI